LGIQFWKEKLLRRKKHLGVDFFYTIVDSLLFICERGYQCIKLGKLDPLFHSGSEYDKFAESVMTLKRQAAILGNEDLMKLENCSEFSFKADLDAAIEKLMLFINVPFK